MNWRPPNWENDTHSKYVQARAHLRTKGGSESSTGHGVELVKRGQFRWKRFFWHHGATEPLLAASDPICANWADAEAWPPETEGKPEKQTEDKGDWMRKRKKIGIFKQDVWKMSSKLVLWSVLISCFFSVAHTHKLSHICIIPTQSWEPWLRGSDLCRLHLITLQSAASWCSWKAHGG